MSVIIKVEYICDRCEESVSRLQDPTYEPDDWVSIYVVNPSSGAVTVPNLKDKLLLCADCYRSWLTWSELKAETNYVGA